MKTKIIPPKNSKQKNVPKEGISLFVPAYNEEKIIKENILTLYNILNNIATRFEIIIVNDNSKDKTRQIANELTKMHKNIILLNFTNGPSRRENLGEAFRRAKYNTIMFCDLDLATDINSIPELLNHIKNGADISTGSRYLTHKPNREKSRLVISKSYNWFMQKYFESKLKDHQCGFKAFKKETLSPLLDELDYDSTFCRGWFWDAELLIRAQKKGYKIIEFPVIWNSGKQSSFSIKRELRMLRYILNLKRKLKKENKKSTI